MVKAYTLKKNSLAEKKIKAANFARFRERSDYNPFPVGYYYGEYFGKRAQRIFHGSISSAVELSSGAYQTGKCRTILGTKKEVEKWRQALLKIIIGKSKFTSRIYSLSDKIGRKFTKFSKELLQLKNKKMSDRKLIALHAKWIEYYTEYGFWNVIIWFIIADELAIYVEKRLTKKYHIPFFIQQTLTMPTEPSYLFEEETQLLQISAHVNFSQKSFSRQSVQVKDLLSKHAERWQWIPFDYIGPIVWREQEFLKRLFALANNRRDAARLLEEKRSYHGKLKAAQEAAIKKYRVAPGLQRILRDLRTITLMQDEKKEVCTLAQFALQSVVFEKIARKLGIRNVDCIKFHHEELWQAINSDSEIIKTLPERLRAMCAVGDKNGITLISGDDAQKIYDKFDSKIKETKNIKGQTASVGKSKGRVRVIISNREVDKIKKGEVLVAPMTTPDFVVAMKKAAAIITDEGGMTSHAAIISRELGIPCVVGTRVATKVLQDGDLVEVDADEGVVKILKRK